MASKSFQEFYDAFVVEVQGQDPTLTDLNTGSKIDVLGGAFSMGAIEIIGTLLDEFRKTFVDTADGPEVTGGPDYLEQLLVDRFGDEFARPEAQKARGVVTFSRPNDDAGDVEIIVGTIVKTQQNAAGSSQSFAVTSPVTLTGLSINASVEAVDAGIAGNVQAGTVTVIETALTDNSVVVTNSASFVGGAAEETDAEYRETYRRLIQQLRGATLTAIRAAALEVSGVEQATGIEFVQTVKEWDIAEDEPVGDTFDIARVKLYISDANGEASDALITAVQDAIEPVRAAGPRVEVVGAIAYPLNWSITIVLNPSGPNYTELSADASMIESTMRLYLQDLDIGESFNRAAAKNYLLSLWGPLGTNDLVNLTNVAPTGDVSIDADEKIIPSTITVG